MSIERQPITRLQTQVSSMKAQQSALRELRTQLLTLRNKAQDFKLGSVFTQYKSTSSEEKVLTSTVSSSTPAVGSYNIEVTKLAGATVATSSATMGGAISPDATLENSGITTDVTAGTFTVNGIEFTVDPATQTLNQVLADITASSAGVNATYDAVTDKITFANKTAGDTRLINFGATDDTSNFLTAVAIRLATQANNGSGSTSASSTVNLGAVSTSAKLSEVNFAGGAITAGTFMVNGVSISVDPATDSLSDILQRINDADAQVTTSYDSATDKIRFVSKTLGDRTIGFNAGTSNFLAITNLAAATQTAGNDSEFKINGGAVQTRNSNEVSDAIGGTTLRFLSAGTSTVTVSSDDDSIVENVNKFITAFNDSVDNVRKLTEKDGTMAGDSSIQAVEMSLRSMIFGMVSGLSGDYASLADIGISTGSTFDVATTSHLELDADKFREALRSDRANVTALFSNEDETGIANTLFDYLDAATQTTGFLNDRAKSNGGIDRQINDLNDQISRIEERVSQHEIRMKQQYARLEQYSAGFQQQSAALSALGSGSSIF
jgi:flagellar hook-associated protein 2